MALRRPAGSLAGGANYDVAIIGLDTVINHLLGFANEFGSFAYQIVDVSADIGVDEAKRLVRVDTGATRDSIKKDPMVSTAMQGIWKQAYGPETFYAPYLEFGTVHTVQSGGSWHTQAYPFMTPSADLVERAFVPAVVGFLDLLAGGQGGGANGHAAPINNHPRVKGSFTNIRSFLYSGAKALGDVSVFGGRELFGPIRASMYKLARALGDVSSTMNATMGQRVTHRLAGRATGHILGYGSASLSFGKTYSSFPGGAAGHRIYQRAAGHLGVGGVGFGGLGFSPSGFKLGG